MLSDCSRSLTITMKDVWQVKVYDLNSPGLKN